VRVAALLSLLAGFAAAEGPTPDLMRRMRAARAKVFPALVHIVNVEEGFARGRREKSVSTGSGFLVDADGHIVTNYHVAGKGKVLVVTLASKRKTEARLVAADPHTDIALLKVDPKRAFPGGEPLHATFGDSSRLREGDFVLAMGSPLSLSRTVSFGIISCRDRVLGRLELRAGEETGKYHTWLQTDAAINPGNSGGPLVSLDGEVIGVNTRASLLANNIGFAIPSNVVREVVAALLEHRTVRRAYLGVRLQPLDDLDQTALAETEGVIVAAVDGGSPAQRAGIRPGDFLVALDGRPVSARFAEQVPDLYNRIARLPVGRPVPVRVHRDESEQVLDVVPELLGRQLGREVEIAPLGLTVRGITARMRVEMSLPDTAGVLVTGVRAGSPAATRLEPGDIVRRIQGAEITGLLRFLETINEARERSDPMLRVAFRRGSVLDVTVLRPEQG